MVSGLGCDDFSVIRLRKGNPEMGRSKLRTRRSIVTMASFYEDQSDAELVIPEDLSTLSDAELADLSTRATEAFNLAYGEDGSGLDDAAFAALGELTQGITALRAESDRRGELATERAEAARAMAAQVNGDGAEGDGEGDGEGDAPEEGDGEGDAPEEDAAADAPAEPEVVTAAGAPRSEQRIPLSAIRRNRPAPRQAQGDAQPSIADFMVASGEGLDVAVGTPLDFEGAGEALNRRLQTFNQAQYENAQKAGRQISSQSPLIQLNRPVDPELQIRSNDPDHVREVFERASDETRLPGGSLVAAGGWCAPSTPMYDLLDTGESRDGILQLPEIGVPRGGVSFTTGPDFVDLFAAIQSGTIGFSFTEEDDINGLYARGTTTAFPLSTAVTVGQTFLVGGAILRVTVAGTTAASAPTPPAQFGQTVVSGTATLVRRETANVAGNKNCYKVTCPPFQEYRLDVDGLCITAGLLQSRGFPEVLADTLRKVLIGHDHYLNGNMITQMAAGSTPVTLPATQAGTAAPVLTAIELQVESYRYARRLARNTTLEAVFPFWIRGAIRSDLSRRLGVDLIDVPDSRIDAWFRERGISAQFVYNWQPISGTAGSATAWPTTVSFLLYRAGTWIRGAADIITVDTLYDSVLLGQNNFTALFTEEGWFVAKRGQDSRLVTTSLTADGATHIGVDIAHNGTAA